VAKRGPKAGRRRATSTTAPLAILGDYTPKQIDQIRQAVLDRATGRRVFVKLKRQGNATNGLEVWEVAGDDGPEDWTGYIYRMDSDPQALKMVVEHFEGRPATKEVAPIDPIVNVLLTVPGKRTVFTCPGCGLKTVGDPNEARPTDGGGEPEKSEEPVADSPGFQSAPPALTSTPAYSFEPLLDIADELFGNG
jgi:hypothetical protein